MDEKKNEKCNDKLVNVSFVQVKKESCYEPTNFHFKITRKLQTELLPHPLLNFV